MWGNGNGRVTRIVLNIARLDARMGEGGLVGRGDGGWKVGDMGGGPSVAGVFVLESWEIAEYSEILSYPNKQKEAGSSWSERQDVVVRRTYRRPSAVP